MTPKEREYLKGEVVKRALELLDDVLSTPPEEDPLYSGGYSLHAANCLSHEMAALGLFRECCTCNLNMEVVVRRCVPVPGEPPKRL